MPPSAAAALVAANSVADLPPAMARGYVSMYVSNVNQADEGCDFGYLQGASGAPVPRESH